jgi:hypothetical protein
LDVLEDFSGLLHFSDRMRSCSTLANICTGLLLLLRLLLLSILLIRSELTAPN